VSALQPSMLRFLSQRGFEPGRCGAVCRAVHTNAGLCGPLVNVGNTGTPPAGYFNGWVGTALTTDCPTAAPTAAPTTLSPTSPTAAPTTVSPTVAPTAAPTTAAPTTKPLPCCETLRLNPIFCCLESRFPAMMARECQECGTK
jgi:hypothetical protein